MISVTLRAVSIPGEPFVAANGDRWATWIDTGKRRGYVNDVRVPYVFARWLSRHL